jgi:hypothetical protein
LCFLVCKFIVVLTHYLVNWGELFQSRGAR